MTGGESCIMVKVGTTHYEQGRYPIGEFARVFPAGPRARGPHPDANAPPSRDDHASHLADRGGDYVAALHRRGVCHGHGYRTRLVRWITGAKAPAPHQVEIILGSVAEGAPDRAIRFQKVMLPAASGAGFTCVQVGPDHRLYAGSDDGRIFRFAILSDGTLGAPAVFDSLQRPRAASDCSPASALTRPRRQTSPCYGSRTASMRSTALPISAAAFRASAGKIWRPSRTWSSTCRDRSRTT